MNRQSSRTVMPGCAFVAVDDPDEQVEQFTIRMDGTTYLPAPDWEFGDVIGSEGTRLGSIFLALQNGFGLHAAMTVVTMRSLAAKMIEVANKIESEAATQAAAALVRAAQPGAAA